MKEGGLFDVSIFVGFLPTPCLTDLALPASWRFRRVSSTSDIDPRDRPDHSAAKTLRAERTSVRGRVKPPSVSKSVVLTYLQYYDRQSKRQKLQQESLAAALLGGDAAAAATAGATAAGAAAGTASGAATAP